MRLCKCREYCCTLRALAFRWGWLSESQYEFVSEQVAEIGKLLGGWIRQTGS